MIEQKPKPDHSELHCDNFVTCFSYSPNWYTEQSLCIDPYDPAILHYASNHLMYTYNRKIHSVVREFSAKIAIKSWMEKMKYTDIGEKEMKTMKLFCIAVTENYMLMGLNEGIIAVFDRKLECILVHRIKVRNINYLMGMEGAAGLEVVVFDENGYCVKVMIKDKVIVRLDVKVEMEGEKRERLKKIIYLNNQFYCFYQKGTIFLFDQSFDKQIRRLTFSKGESILYVDNQKDNIILLSKDKQSLVLNYFKIETGLQFALEHTKTIFQITKSINKCFIEIEYPKKYYYKRQDMKKAALCVQWLENGKFLMTGRLAQIYIFDLSKPPKQKKLVLKPFSMETNENPIYETLPQSKHYNQIYQVYRNGNEIMMIGTDRNLTFWSLRNTSDLVFEYGIKFLASAVKNIILSRCERNIAFFLMQDSVIRNWQMGRQGCQYKLNEFWKAGQKLKMLDAHCDPHDQGIICSLTDQRKIVFYDLYEERLVRSQQLQTMENNIFIEYINSESVPDISAMFETELTPIKLETKQFSKKKLSQKNWIMVQLSNSLVLLNSSNSSTFTCAKFFKNMEKDQKVEGVTVSNQTIISFVRSPTSLQMKVLSKDKKILEYKFHQKNIFDHPSVKVIQSENTRYLFLALYSKKDLSVYIFQLTPEALTLYKTTTLLFNYFIEEAEFDSKGNRLLAYSLNNNTVQIWELQTNLEDKQKPISSISKNIKAHYGNLLKARFFMDNFVVSCCQDQNIKVWDLSQCKQRAPPKAKKHKKKKGPTQNPKVNKVQKKQTNIEVEQNKSDQQEQEVQQNK